jgi:hypothetical protein
MDNFKIALNQNLWGLVVGLAGLGTAEYFKLNALYYISLSLSVGMLASVFITTAAYTLNYKKSKSQNQKQ